MIDHPQELAWRQGERETVAVMGTINAAVARLVTTIRMLLDTGGWEGWGIQSPEHWVTWKAAVSRHRADGLVQVARRVPELLACWALFEQGGITEDAMVRVARRVPADHDAAVAAKLATVTISQLDRMLAACPPLPKPESEVRPRQPRDRRLELGIEPDGWTSGRFCLPPDEGAVLRNGLVAARDAEFRDRQGLEPDADLDDVPEHVRRWGVSWADALVRMSSEGADALDPSVARCGRPGERNKVVLHIDVDHEGTFGPGQLHLGPVVPHTVARFLGCDAEVMVAAYKAGQLIGITPTLRTVSRALRRVIERRDQGCAHPLCTQRRFLHIHHIVYWEHRGLTVPENLICLCPTHHRAQHAGDFRIEGNPEAGTVRFVDPRGRPIEPPGTGPPMPVRIDEPSPFQSPHGERLSRQWFAWN